jgi:hypothetical protein
VEGMDRGTAKALSIQGFHARYYVNCLLVTSHFSFPRILWSNLRIIGVLWTLNGTIRIVKPGLAHQISFFASSASYKRHGICSQRHYIQLGEWADTKAIV